MLQKYYLEKLPTYSLQLVNFFFIGSSKYRTVTECQYLDNSNTEYDIEKQKIMLKFYIECNNPVNFIRYAESAEIDLEFEDNFLFKSACNERGDDTTILKYLIENGVDVCCMDNYGIKMCAKNYPSIVPLLIEHGADVTADNNYALKNSLCNYIFDDTNQDVINDYLNSIEQLLKHGSNPNIYNGQIISLLIQFSIINSYRYTAYHLKVLQLLVNYGLDLGPYGNELLARNMLDGNELISKFLIDNGCSPNCLTEKDLTRIVSKKYHRIIKLLLDFKVDFSFINKMDLLNTSNTYQTYKLLTDSGVNPEQFIKLVGI